MPAVSTERIVQDALYGFGDYAPGEQISAADADFCLSTLNQILDGWNAERQAVWASIFSTFALTPSLQPHTIGPTGDWIVPERPVSIEDAAILLGTNVWQRIGVYTDPDWWASQTSPGLSTGSTGLYYVPDVPNGSVYLGPTTTGTSIRLLLRRLITALVLTDVVVWPQGYQQALTLTLMEAIAEGFHYTLTERTIRRAGQARAKIFANNVIVPTLSTRGVPGGHGGWWNYRTGVWE